ncbi:hypothetical protein BJ875DRAFT_3873 [Amylocarpus encephaloides]|uniref:Uncharacterized protein n=1 Tax=Amylocarpus encephaloides TaxID=45428 RepID=A0A9P8C9T7_9HELO|nr:hypothetical protein BJ875DRAFT_3873 [Amylocarpus encephaloides]
MSSSQPGRTASSNTTRLDRTLKALQDRVKEQEALLEELRSSVAPIETEPSADIKSHLRQLRALKTVYETLTLQKPWLPSTKSPLPALLALRATDRCIKGTKICVTETEDELKVVQQRLTNEQGYLNDAKLIQVDLKSRITSLQEEIDERTQKPPSQIAKDMIRDLEAKQTFYNDETMKLVRAFNLFIDTHLAPMLAAEELGGPIVGDNLEVDEIMLEAGFSAQGKVKKSKSKPSEDKRQRRIDQIWGERPHDDVMEEDAPWDEARAAGAEMRNLTESLLNSLMQDPPGSYVDLTRESAAARFLVRSKVAQFHPRDARKLRLVDFGGEVEN